MNVDIDAALAVALRAADAAALLVREAHNKAGAFHVKADDSVVTETDHAVETAIRRELHAAFPDHGIVGEEYGADRETNPFCWLVDPIDGTVSFVNGLPFAGTLIALSYEGRSVLSVVDFPLGTRAWAIAGRGAWEHGARLHVRADFDASRSVVCHGDLYTFEMAGYELAFRTLQDRCRHFRSYTDAFGHYLVASGSAAAVVDAAMEIWDIAAVRLLVEEAGGKTHSFPDLRNSKRVLLVSGAPQAVDWLVPVITDSLSKPTPL